MRLPPFVERRQRGDAVEQRLADLLAGENPTQPGRRRAQRGSGGPVRPAVTLEFRPCLCNVHREGE